MPPFLLIDHNMNYNKQKRLWDICPHLKGHIASCLNAKNCDLKKSWANFEE